MKPIQKLTSVREGSFNSQSYLDRYAEFGEFPKIHRDISQVFRSVAQKGEITVDIGSCIGILAMANHAHTGALCIGFEANQYDFNRSLKAFSSEIAQSHLYFYNLAVNDENLKFIGNDMLKCCVKTVTARRVLSEVGYYDTTVVQRFGLAMSNAGVENVIIEGRTPVKNPTVKLWNSDLEARALAPYYVIEDKFKSVIHLKRAN
jgi:hypothetical protein